VAVASGGLLGLCALGCFTPTLIWLRAQHYGYEWDGYRNAYFNRLTYFSPERAAIAAAGNSTAAFDHAAVQAIYANRLGGFEWYVEPWLRRALFYTQSALLLPLALAVVPNRRLPLLTETGTHSVYPYMLHYWLLRLLLAAIVTLNAGPLAPFDLHGAALYYYLPTMLVQPAFIVLYASPPVRYCLWPLLEPFWAHAAFKPLGAAPMPLLHPLETLVLRSPHAGRLVAAHAGRLAFWGGLALTALTMRMAVRAPLSGADTLVLD